MHNEMKWEKLLSTNETALCAEGYNSLHILYFPNGRLCGLYCLGRAETCGRLSPGGRLSPSGILSRDKCVSVRIVLDGILSGWRIDSVHNVQGHIVLGHIVSGRHVPPPARWAGWLIYHDLGRSQPQLVILFKSYFSRYYWHETFWWN